MKLLFRGSQEFSKPLMALSANGICIEVANVAFLEVDGVPYVPSAEPFKPGPAPTPTPTPAATPVLPTDFGSGSIDDQVKVLLQWQFDHPEWSPAILIDGNPYGQPGQYPAARFTTAGGKLRLESLLQAAADAGLSGGQFVAVREAIKSATVDPTRLWETTPSTLDPASMSFLLVWQGGPNALEKAKAYRVTYYKRYGKQCMLPDAPRNPEAAWITDQELAQIIAS